MPFHRIKLLLAPITVIAFALLASRYILANKPEPTAETPEELSLSVDVASLEQSPFQVFLHSQGKVQPTRTQMIVPEVAGTVVEIGKAFRSGSLFKRGDLLLKVDDREYKIALKQAEANLAQAEAQLLEQQALASQAVAEWESIGRSGKPSSLTLREPQLAAAEANRDAAGAQLEKALLDLERTLIVAPFDGIVGQRSLEVGQYVNRGTLAGTIHDTSAFEVTLPITPAEIPMLNTEPSSGVTLRSVIGDRINEWKANVVRTEGLDATTQQLKVVVEVQDPLALHSAQRSQTPLRLDTFVEAILEGKLLRNVYAIPQGALRAGDEVLLVKDGVIQRQSVRVVWSDNQWSAVDDGINEGDSLIVTPLSTVADGTPVNPIVTELDFPFQTLSTSSLQ